jgi:hypothetical protein
LLFIGGVGVLDLRAFCKGGVGVLDLKGSGCRLEGDFMCSSLLFEEQVDKEGDSAVGLGTNKLLLPGNSSVYTKNSQTV